MDPKATAFALLLCSPLLAGCPKDSSEDMAPPADLSTSPDLSAPPPADQGGAADQGGVVDQGGGDLAGCRDPACLASLRPQTFDFRGKKNLDVLFLIDNSPSMSPKQRALAEAIPRFMQKIDATNADYQVAIATSDVGTWTAPNTPWPTSLGTCNTYEGDDGLLQRVACTTRTGLTSEAISACAALCPDPRFVPQAGAGFIRKIAGVTNVPILTDPVTQKDIGPQRAFQCMAMVGDAGCGIEGVLEGAKRALDGHLASNSGFPRPGSVVAAILISDEDDCSVALRSRAENHPSTRDCAAADKNAAHDCFNPDYRCLARSTDCNEPLNSAGVKTGCREKAQSYLEPVATYVDFFRKLRPVGQLLLSGIWAPAAGRFQVEYLSNGAMISPNLNRATGASAACVSPTDVNVYGRPQHRLSKLLQSFPGSVEVSVCDTANYPSALDRISSAISTQLRVYCLNEPPLLVNNAPLCLVGDVSAATPDAVPAQPMGRCGAGCCDAWSRAAMPTADDAAVRAACTPEAADCYCAQVATAGSPADIGGVCGGGAIAGVWRKGGGGTPAGSVVSFRCAR